MFFLVAGQLRFYPPYTNGGQEKGFIEKEKYIIDVFMKEYLLLSIDKFL